MMRTRSKFGQNHTSKTFTFNIEKTILSIYFTNKAISDKGITVDFWITKVHTSN